jgi:hypothetical protein
LEASAVPPANEFAVRKKRQPALTARYVSYVGAGLQYFLAANSLVVTKVFFAFSALNSTTLREIESNCG